MSTWKELVVNFPIHFVVLYRRYIKLNIRITRQLECECTSIILINLFYYNDMLVKRGAKMCCQII